MLAMVPTMKLEICPAWTPKEILKATIDQDGEPCCGDTKQNPFSPCLRKLTSLQHKHKKIPLTWSKVFSTSNLRNTPSTLALSLLCKHSLAIKTESRIFLSKTKAFYHFAKTIHFYRISHNVLIKKKRISHNVETSWQNLLLYQTNIGWNLEWALIL